jgi:hypothetical protein
MGTNPCGSTVNCVQTLTLWTKRSGKSRRRRKMAKNENNTEKVKVAAPDKTAMGLRMVARETEEKGEKIVKDKIEKGGKK